ncbi:cilia- and flagella-associated protein 97-like [Pseudomyrmex gracilis]|uniref:cilia- and flagella-associated protein 97-like n=1 Tax=Pseudomyrmex gracilis TaxID=219809 RepID=UPI00099591D0|nr:cilia- and flagella-associated protein 97-like [Pseudomyrmex gracilis]
MKIVGRNFEFLAAPCFALLDDPFCLIMVNPDETVTCECLYTAGGDARVRECFSIPNIHEIDEEDSETEETETTEQTNCSPPVKKDEENAAAETQTALNNEVYTEDSFCSDESCEDEDTDVTSRSLTSSLPCVADVQRSRSSNEREIDESKWQDDGSYSLGDHQHVRAATASRLVNRSRKCRRWNMSFTDDEMRKIERENELLLRKIMAQQKPRHRIVDEHTAQPRTSSSAINRKKLQKKIESDNMLLLRRIQQAKSCVFSNASKMGCRLTFL